MSIHWYYNIYLEDLQRRMAVGMDFADNLVVVDTLGLVDKDNLLK